MQRYNKFRFLQNESEQAIDQIPCAEAGEFAYEHEDDCPERTGLVEAESYGYYVSNEGNPAGESQPDSVSVNLFLLFLQGLRLYLEPFLDPFPLSDPAYPVCQGAAEPVPESADQKTSDGIGGRCQYGQIKRIGTEREDSRRQKRSYEQT